MGFVLVSIGMATIIPFVPREDSGWAFVIPLAIIGCGLGLLVSQLNNYTLAPVEEERVSAAAGVNSAAGSFGLSFGLAQQQQIGTALEDDAEVMSDTQLAQQITGQPPAVDDEVVAINDDARNLR